MAEETQKFIEAEETASRLVLTLQQLHTEAKSYQTATTELDAVRKQLVSLIESTQQVVNESLESVKVLRQIGGPEILRCITQMQAKTTDAIATVESNLNKRLDAVQNEMNRFIIPKRRL
jgi:ABC-type phosphate transport system auxiliary subunit